jgi:hypothetical protein
MTVIAVTSPEKTLLRKDGQWSELYLATLVPQTVFTAILDDLPTSFDQVAEITYITGSGTLADIREGMTMYVGSSAGAHDLGMVRIRKTPTADIFYIGEQSRVIWQSAAYLTVVEDFDLWAKHLHIDGTTPFMDYDVAYTDQHEDFNPVPVLGVHRVAKLTGATVDVGLGCDTPNGDASWVFDSTISSYLWDIPSATAIDDDTAVNPVATFDSVGWHACYCAVTAANGKSKTGMRWVFIWDDNNLPATSFKVSGWSEDYESGGSSCKIVLADEASLSEIRERSLCILFSVDHYGKYDDHTEQSIGQVTGAENVRFVGRVGDENLEYDFNAGVVSFELQGYQYWFSKIPSFPAGVEIATDTPDVWTSLPALTVDRGIWHLIEWHSTSTAIMDFMPSGDTRYSPEVSAFTGNLWSQMDEFAFQQIRAHAHVDMFGRLFIEVDPQMIPIADRAASITTVMDLTGDDVKSGVSLEKQIVSDVSMVDASGISIDQYGGSPLSYFAVAPGHVFGEFGSVEIVDRLLIENQAECNEIAGLLYGWKVNKYKELNIELVGNNNMISCFPNQYVTYTVSASDTPRGEALSVDFIPRRRSIDFDNESGIWEYQIDLEPTSSQENSVAYTPPEGDDVSIPPLPPIPTIPSFFPTYPGDAAGITPKTVVLVDNSQGILRTSNFDAVQPTWQFWNSGIDSADKAYIANASVDNGSKSVLFQVPNGGVYVAVYEKASQRAFDTVYYAPAIGAKFTKVITQAILNTMTGESNTRMLSMGFNPNKPDEVALILRGGFSGGQQFMLGNTVNSWTNKLSYNPGTYDFSGALTFGADQWTHDSMAAGDEKFRIFSADGTTIIYGSPSFGQGDAHWHVRAGTSSIIVKSKPGVTGINGIIRSEDGGQTRDVIDPSPASEGGNFAISYDGEVLFGNVDNAGSRRGRSLDGGYSWDHSFFTYGSYFCYAYCGGIGTASRWILGRGYVRYSDDAGANWVAKEGNLAYLIPTGMVIAKIVVPGYY